jgi:solute carrier family 25 (mitochondrial carnitine/acylcarnitine transporter), member 20/29
MGGPLVTIPLVNAIVFASYGMAKNFLSAENEENEPLTLTQMTLAGSFAGMTNSIIVSPSELIKTKIQVQYGFTNTQLKGPLEAAQQIVSKEGFKGLYRGMGATVAREVCFFSINIIYKILTFWLYRYLVMQDSSPPMNY